MLYQSHLPATHKDFFFFFFLPLTMSYAAEGTQFNALLSFPIFTTSGMRAGPCCSISQWGAREHPTSGTSHQELEMKKPTI